MRKRVSIIGAGNVGAMKIRHSEKVAKCVLEMAFPGAHMEFRCKQSDKEYDFDLHYPDGEIAAVEVTSSRDQTITQISKEVFARHGGAEIPANQCRKTWLIQLERDANIKFIRKYADCYLAELEAAGIEGFELQDCLQRNCPEQIARIHKDLKLIYASSLLTSASPIIKLLSVDGPARAYISTSATDAAEREIEPNKEKLGRATTKERHLVVYIDLTTGEAWSAMTRFPPPPVVPTLPAEVTHLWLIAQTDTDQFVVWDGSLSMQWRARIFNSTP
jgi:hypothetical protein